MWPTPQWAVMVPSLTGSFTDTWCRLHWRKCGTSGDWLVSKIARRSFAIRSASARAEWSFQYCGVAWPNTYCGKPRKMEGQQMVTSLWKEARQRICAQGYDVGGQLLAIQRQQRKIDVVNDIIQELDLDMSPSPNRCGERALFKIRTVQR